MKLYSFTRRLLSLFVLCLITNVALADGVFLQNAITNYDFNDGNFDGWTQSTPNGGNHGRPNTDNCPDQSCAEYWIGTATNGKFDYYQQLTDLPNGKYYLVAKMWNSTDGAAGSVNGECGVYASTSQMTVFKGVTKDTRHDGRSDYQTDPIIVFDGKLRVGVKNNKTMTARWFGVDYVKLYYVGPATEDELFSARSSATGASDCLCFTSTGDAKICLANVNGNTQYDFQYSTDGTNWVDYAQGVIAWTGKKDSDGCDKISATGTYASSYIDISYGKKVYFRAKHTNGALSNGNDNYYRDEAMGVSAANRRKEMARYQFFHSGSGDIYASGNVMSLIDPQMLMTEVPSTCFSNLFRSMSTLKTAPRMPATTLGEWCYEFMFRGCSNLVTGPTIPASVYTTGCCQNMLDGCTSLEYVDVCFKTASRSRTTDDIAIGGMFTNVKSSCQFWLFHLKDADNNMKEISYGGSATKHWKDNNAGVSSVGEWLRFANGGSSEASISLTHADTYQIQYSFDGTTWNDAWTHSHKEISEDAPCPECNGLGYSLTKVDAGDCTWSEEVKINTTSYTTNSCDGGILSKKVSGKTYYFGCRKCGGTTGSGITDKNNVVKGTGRIYEYLYKGCSNCMGSGEKQLPNNDNPSDGGGFKRGTGRISGIIDVEEVSPKIITLGVGKHAYFRAKVDNSANSSFLQKHMHFEMLGSINASGNVMSLIKADGNLDEVPQYAFYHLFDGCTSLRTAPELPATKLTAHCYEGMFRKCNHIYISPVLPAQTLTTACYKQMFYDCSSLQLISSDFKDWDYANSDEDEDGNIIPTDSYATYQWVHGVDKSKTNRFNNGQIKRLIYNEHHIPYDEENPWYVGDENYLTFTAITAGTTKIALKKNGNPNEIKLTFQKTGPGVTDTRWLEYQFGKELTITQGQSISFRAGTNYGPDGALTDCTNPPSDKRFYYQPYSNSKFSINKDNYYQFSFSKQVEASGNLFSLLSYDCSNDEVPNNAFYYLFINAKNLMTAPELPGTLLGDSCYYAMFYNCTSLTEAPVLPATQLKTSCYALMFNGCTALQQAPVLPATTLANYCYNRMFQNSGLTSAPALPATTLRSNCYRYMFDGCTNLTEASYLPAQKAYTSCYSYMYRGTAIEQAPALPAKELASTCYAYMFENCTQLITGPNELPATTLKTNCYKGMFKGCSNLTSIHVSFTDWGNDKEYTEEWVSGVSEEGTFFCPEGLETSYGANRVPLDNNHPWRVIKNPYICFLATVAGTKVQLKANGGVSGALLQYSTTGNVEDWHPYAPGSEITLPNRGSIALFRAPVTYTKTLIDCSNHCTKNNNEDHYMVDEDSERIICPKCSGTGKEPSYSFDYSKSNSSFSTSASNYYQFAISENGGVDLSGDVSCLINGEYHGASTQSFLSNEWTAIPNDYAFYGLFKGCKNMTGKADLPYINLTTHCYQSLYEGCEMLTVAPQLPTGLPNGNITESCYEDLFKGCISLYSAPTIPSVVRAKACYKGMFSGCASLVDNIPTVLQASAESVFESMFEGCSSLETAPKLTGEWINSKSCFKAMFRGCTSLLEVAEMETKFTSESMCESMYEGCTALEKGGTLNMREGSDAYNKACFKNMFKGCTALVKTPTFVKSNLNESCFEGMFEGCTALSGAPVLPQPALAPYCYKRMFAGCTKLPVAPELPAEVPVEGCYYEMFKGCSSLAYMDVAFKNTVSNTWWTENDTEEEPSYTYHWVDGVASVGIFMCSADLPRKYDISHIPFGWRAEDNGDYLCFTGANKWSDDNYYYVAIGLVNGLYNNSNCVRALKYSYDKETWETLSSGSMPALGGTKKRVYLKCSNGFFTDDPETPLKFTFSDDVIVSGNVMSLLDPSMTLNEVPEYSFYKLFENQTHITDASYLKLPAEKVGDYAYADMFAGCTTLQNSQRTAPALPATSLGKHCYENLFAGWKALEKAPKLPATKLVEGCYNGIFNGCSNLSEITVSFSNWVENTTEDWVNGVQNKGDFYCPANLLQDAINQFGSANKCYYAYGPSRIPKDADNGADHKWVIFLDVDMSFDYSKNQLILAGGNSMYYCQDPDEKISSTDVAKITNQYSAPVDITNWVESVADLDSTVFYAASRLEGTGIDSELCQSVVRNLTVYGYPKYYGYCMAEDEDKLRKSLYYAGQVSSKKYPVRIFVPNGTYSLNCTESEKTLSMSNYVSLIGQSNDKTVIETSGTPLQIDGNYCYLQDMTLQNASGHAFENKGSNTTLHVDLGTGNDYLNAAGKQFFIDPAWNTGDAKGDYAVVDKILVNGGAINVVSRSNTYLVEMRNKYDITDCNSFYISGGAAGSYTVRAANQYGAFGPYFKFSEAIPVTATNDAGDNLEEYTGLQTTIKLNDYGYSSFYYEAEDGHRLKAIGASAFVATCRQIGSPVKLYHINDKDIIPSKTGVILFGHPGTVVKFYVDKTSDITPYRDVLASNTLKGTVTAITAQQENRYFGLSGDTFRKMNIGGTIKPHKAYFDFGSDVQDAPLFRAAFGSWYDFDIYDSLEEVEEETGIYDFQLAQKKDVITPAYNLMGQRTDSQKGLLIQNGKVVLMK